MRCGAMSAKNLIIVGYGIPDHNTGKVLAYVFGRRKDEVFLQLKALLEPFGISQFYTDGWGAYERHLEENKHEGANRTCRK